MKAPEKGNIQRFQYCILWRTINQTLNLNLRSLDALGTIDLQRFVAGPLPRFG